MIVLTIMISRGRPLQSTPPEGFFAGSRCWVGVWLPFDILSIVYTPFPLFLILLETRLVTP